MLGRKKMSGPDTRSFVQRIKRFFFLRRLEKLELEEDWPRFIKVARAWTRSEPEDFEAWYALGLGLSGAGDSKGELDAYRKAIELHPDDTQSLVNIGAALCELERYSEAEPFLRRAQKARHEDVLAYENLARCLVAQGKHDDVTDVLSELMKLGRLSVLGARRPELQLQVLEALQRLSPTLRDHHVQQLQPFFKSLGMPSR